MGELNKRIAATRMRRRRGKLYQQIPDGYGKAHISIVQVKEDAEIGRTQPFLFSQNHLLRVLSVSAPEEGVNSRLFQSLRERASALILRISTAASNAGLLI